MKKPARLQWYKEAAVTIWPSLLKAPAPVMDVARLLYPGKARNYQCVMTSRLLSYFARRGLVEIYFGKIVIPSLQPQPCYRTVAFVKLTEPGQNHDLHNA